MIRTAYTLILLEGRRLAGVEEALARPRILADEVAEWLRAPGTYYDPQTVNDDLGFSVRVPVCQPPTLRRVRSQGSVNRVPEPAQCPLGNRRKGSPVIESIRPKPGHDGGTRGEAVVMGRSAQQLELGPGLTPGLEGGTTPAPTDDRLLTAWRHAKGVP